jgi:hypothetical protein
MMNNNEAKQSHSKLPSFVFGAAILGLLGIFLCAAFLIARSQDFMRNGDFFEFWLAGKMFWEGRGLYDPVIWDPPHALHGNYLIKNPVFPYPPVLALFFAPLGLGSLPFAAVSWVFICEGLILGTVALLVSLWRMQGLSLKPYFWPLLVGVFLFRPTMVTLRNGQLGALFLFLLALTVYFWEQKKWFWGGVCLAVVAIRPNLGLPILGLVGLWLAWTRRWTAILGVGVSAIGLILICFLMDPNWIQGMLSVGSEKISRTFGHHPVVWGLSFANCGFEPVCGWSWGGIAFLFAGALVIWTLWKNRAIEAPLVKVGLLFSFALWGAPYLWAYDQILLVIPILGLAGISLARQKPYLFAATTTLWFSIFALILLAISMQVGNDVFSGLLSVGPLIVLAFSKWPTSSWTNHPPS